MKLLKNKVVIITGGSGDIGNAIIKNFVNNGAIVIFTFLSSEKKSKQLELELSGSVESYKIDLSKTYLLNTFVKYVINKYGHIDILINNAGIIRDNIIFRISDKDWDDVMKINLYSIFSMTKYVGLHMLRRNKGNIINMSSVVGTTGNIGQANYSASKAGIIGFTKTISKELGKKNIRCNVISPGYIMTRINKNLSYEHKKKIISSTSLKRIGYPEEVANCALFLASDLSSYITGSVIHVNGGII